jgi:hypothetical protein
MTKAAKTPREQVRRLSPEDRIGLVDDILASLDEAIAHTHRQPEYWRDRLTGT